MVRNRLRFIRRVLYRMKRNYGLPISLYTSTPGALNLETGATSMEYTKVDIKRAIVQPARYHRDFVYDLAYISANKDFTTGGFFDTSDRRVIIDASDLPASWEIDLNQFVIFDGRRFDIKSFYEFEEGMGYILVIRELKGQDVVSINSVNSVLTLQQTVTGVKV